MTRRDTTPVLVGLGCRAQREDDPLRAEDALGLMIAAARRAGADCGNASLLAGVGRILVPKGRWRYGDPGRAVAQAIGASRATTVLATVGVLQQSLIGDCCSRISAGEIDAALVVGGEASYRQARAKKAGVAAPLLEALGEPDVVLAPAEELLHPAETRAGLTMPVALYAIMESAFRARNGWTPAEHADRLATLYSRFSAIAADNPAAWHRNALVPGSIRVASERNPMPAFPYTRSHCASWTVDQAAALLLCSVDKAQALGIDRSKWVFPWASTESNYMEAVCERDRLDASLGARVAGEAALRPVGLDARSIDLIELYSCFPVAVQLHAEELGLDLSRDLTVTGGMPFAGGPFNNYVLQSTCRMAELLRQGAGKTGLVSSVSGLMTKHGFGLWASESPEGGFQFDDVSDAVARASRPRVVLSEYTGPARVAGYTVVYERSQPVTGVAICNVEGNRRVVAVTQDRELMETMQSTEQCGENVTIFTGARGLQFMPIQG